MNLIWKNLGGENREENENAWRVSAEDIIKSNYNLDIKKSKQTGRKTGKS